MPLILAYLRKQKFIATFSNIYFSTLNLKNICLEAVKMERFPMFLNLHATVPESELYYISTKPGRYVQ